MKFRTSGPRGGTPVSSGDDSSDPVDVVVAAEAPGATSASAASDAPAGSAASHPGPKLGDLLVSHGVMDTDTLAAALLEQQGTRWRLGEIPVEQGLLSDDDLARALAEQLGLERVDLRRTAPEPDALAGPRGDRAHVACDLRAGHRHCPARGGHGSPDERAQLRDQAGGRASVPRRRSASDLDRAIDRLRRAVGTSACFVTGFADTDAIATPETQALTFDDNAGRTGGAAHHHVRGARARPTSTSSHRTAWCAARLGGRRQDDVRGSCSSRSRSRW
ncbi:MAG: hypothetical protein U0W40_19795 [Acidimicrobiia bacterium]